MAKQNEAPATETPAAAATTEAAAAASRKVADHAYVGADGATVEHIHEATGILYTDVASGVSFTYQIPGAVVGAPSTMLAIFGAKTLAVNTASGARQARAKGDSQQTDIERITERFGEITEGAWFTPSEGGSRAPKWDKAVLASVIVDLKAAAGVTIEHAAVLQKLTEDAAYFAKARAVPQVVEEYNARTKKETVVRTLDDI